MKMQDQDTERTEANIQAPRTARRRGWLAGIGALIIVLAIISASVVVFATLGQRHNGQGTPAPGAGQWQKVLQGYLVISLQAAPGDPSVVYACATTSAAISYPTLPGAITVLRSVDGGAHWQNIGAKLLLGASCNLAVNPTNSSDLYVINGPASERVSATLLHSTNGGQTWETIQPVLRVPSLAPGQFWFMQQLRFVGKNLYGVQGVMFNALQQPPIPPGGFVTRLFESTDGGHSWNALDTQFASQGMGAQSYAVDPTAPGTIYDLEGKPVLPIERVTPNNPVPTYGAERQLYKTTDGGATWSLVLSNIPYGARVQMASGNPRLLYVGGVIGPLPVAAQGSAQPQSPKVTMGFHLQISRDGGASWQQITIPPEAQNTQLWFVSADGHVYTSPTMTFVEPGQGTSVGATSVPGVSATPVSTSVPIIPTSTTLLPGGTPLSAFAGSTFVYHTATPVSIESYDPSSNTWSKVTTPPAPGLLIQVTAASNGGTALWFNSISGNALALYKYA